jgi:hypothetical protein
MRIHTIIGNNQTEDSQTEFVEEMQKNFSVSFSHSFQDYEHVPWESYKDGALGIEKRWIKNDLTRLYANHGEFIDIVAYAVPEPYWENGTRAIWGWHVGRQIRDYEVIIYQMRPDYFDTAEHEVFHCLDDIVWEYLGYSLEDVLGVSDYDQDVIHGNDPRFEEYKWDDIAEQIAPHVEKAIKVKRGEISQSRLQRLLVNMRGWVLRMRSQLHEITKGKRKKK